MYEGNIYCYNSQTLLIDILIVVSFIDIQSLFLTLLTHVQCFDTCCSVDQIKSTSAFGTEMMGYRLVLQHKG